MIVRYPLIPCLRSRLIMRKADPLSKDPEAVKVKEWRHKLQRAFLSTKGVPAEAVSRLSSASGGQIDAP
jgi:hypothetical protein